MLLLLVVSSSFAGSVGAQTSALPEPTASPQPTSRCVSSPARVRKASPPEYPASAAKLHLGPKSVLVQVDIDATGKLVNATVLLGSGNVALDEAALGAAKRSTYQAANADCHPVSSYGIFKANFAPNRQTPAP